MLSKKQAHGPHHPRLFAASVNRGISEASPTWRGALASLQRGPRWNQRGSRLGSRNVAEMEWLKWGSVSNIQHSICLQSTTSLPDCLCPTLFEARNKLRFAGFLSAAAVTNFGVKAITHFSGQECPRSCALFISQARQRQPAR